MPARRGARLPSAPPVLSHPGHCESAENGEKLAANDVVPAGGPVGDGDYLMFKTPDEAYVRLVWLPLHSSAVRLGWEAMVTKHATRESYRLVIDAQTGEALFRQGLTFHISSGDGTMFSPVTVLRRFRPGFPRPVIISRRLT